MKQMVCEMCGGIDLLKQDGYFVCQSCGTKYTGEEARKMMIEGTVVVDNSSNIGNYLKIAKQAYENHNLPEAEQYCNKIIEIDPNHAEAWLLKGFAAAWQSTGGNLRMDEFFSCAASAFRNASDTESLYNMGRKAYEEYYSLALSINKSKVDALVSLPDQDICFKYLDLRVDLLKKYLDMQLQYFAARNSHTDAETATNTETPWPEHDDLEEKMDTELYERGLNWWNKEIKEYNASCDGYPPDYAFNRMRKNGRVAVLMMERSIPSDVSKIEKMTYQEKQIIIKRCKELITMYWSLDRLCSYSTSYSNGVESHYVHLCETPETKEKLRKEIRECHRKIKACDPNYQIPMVKNAFEEAEEQAKRNRRAKIIVVVVCVLVLVAFYVGLYAALCQ